jgi:hypothetical protein
MAACLREDDEQNRDDLHMLTKDITDRCGPPETVLLVAMLYAAEVVRAFADQVGTDPEPLMRQVAVAFARGFPPQG